MSSSNRTEEHKEVQRKIKEKAEHEFDRVRDEFISGELLTKINLNGHCQFFFEKLGKTVLDTKRKCERENGHKGAHMFGLNVDSGLMVSEYEN